MQEIWLYGGWAITVLLGLLALKFAEQLWLFYRQQHYKGWEEPTLFEIKVPREILRGAKAMEQFFSGLHSLRNVAGSFGEKYIDGETTRRFSFELLGTNGIAHFYMRTPRFLADAVKALLYSQYNDLEIIEQKEDYLTRLPRSYDDLNKIGYEIWGMEASLENKPAFPLTTYEEYEDKGGEERLVDPIAFFIEAVNNMPSDETIMLQLIVKPWDERWKKEGEDILKDMMEKLKVFKDGEFTGRQERETEHDKEVAKAIEKKIARDGFKTIARYIHIAPKATFNVFFGYRGFFAFFNQLSSSVNAFKKNHKTWTKIDWFIFPFVFPKRRLYERKKAIYSAFIRRYFPEETWAGKLMRSNFWRYDFYHKTCILSTSELATLFHPPTNVVITTGLMDRVESKRVAPPAQLPR